MDEVDLSNKFSEVESKLDNSDICQQCGASLNFFVFNTHRVGYTHECPVGQDISNEQRQRLRRGRPQNS